MFLLVLLRDTKVPKALGTPIRDHYFLVTSDLPHQSPVSETEGDVNDWKNNANQATRSLNRSNRSREPADARNLLSGGATAIGRASADGRTNRTLAREGPRWVRTLDKSLTSILL